MDLVAICADASETANQALDRLEATFKADGRFATRLVRKKPCIRLEYAPDDVGKFHVDVVPARYNSSPSRAPLQVPRRDEGWYGSDPAAYTQWCLRQGDAYARTVKVMKRWRSHQQSVRTAIKSIVLQVLVAECMPFGLNDATRVGGTIQALHEHLKELGRASARLESGTAGR